MRWAVGQNGRDFLFVGVKTGREFYGMDYGDGEMLAYTEREAFEAYAWADESDDFGGVGVEGYRYFGCIEPE